MGKAISIIQRAGNRFNIENRAHKVISREKPTPAPKHPSAVREFERLIKEHPEILEKHKQEFPELADRLKKVFVVSHDPIVELQQSDHSRPLPESRVKQDLNETDFPEPAMIPLGRCSIRQALKFISDHNSNPAISASVIAKEYKLNPNTVENILQHFASLEVFIPEGNEKRSGIERFVVSQKILAKSPNLQTQEQPRLPNSK